MDGFQPELDMETNCDVSKQMEEDLEEKVKDKLDFEENKSNVGDFSSLPFECHKLQTIDVRRLNGILTGNNSSSLEPTKSSSSCATTSSTLSQTNFSTSAMTTTTNTFATTKQGTISSSSYDITNTQKEVGEKNDDYLGAEEFPYIEFGSDENLDSSITGPLLDGTLGRCLSGSARSSNKTATTESYSAYNSKKTSHQCPVPMQTKTDNVTSQQATKVQRTSPQTNSGILVMTTTTYTPATTKQDTTFSSSNDITNKQTEVDKKKDSCLGLEEFPDIDFGSDENLDYSITGPLLDGTLGGRPSSSAKSVSTTATTRSYSANNS